MPMLLGGRSAVGSRQDPYSRPPNSANCLLPTAYCFQPIFHERWRVDTAETAYYDSRKNPTGEIAKVFSI